MRRFPAIAALAACIAAVALPATAALETGAKAPDFTAPAYLAGKPFTFKLADALKQGPVVVYFFPAAHTPGCNLEAHLFSEAIDKFKAEHATVIGVTAGNTDQLAAFSTETEHCGGKFAVAADPGAKIAAQYDAVLDKKPEWSNRTSYAIAPVHSDLNPNLHVKAMLDAVAALEAKP
jgi:peroxiredoxin